jgi:hypothetical protein
MECEERYAQEEEMRALQGANFVWIPCPKSGGDHIFYSSEILLDIIDRIAILCTFSKLTPL